MGPLRYYLLTGATSGLGLQTAARLAAADKANIVIAGVRETARLEDLRRVVPAAQLQVMTLDISSLASVKRFAADVVGFLGANTLSAIALNAGVQIVSGDRYSEDGFELTFATNVLGHIALFQRLQTALSPAAVVVSTASGTTTKTTSWPSHINSVVGIFLRPPKLRQEIYRPVPTRRSLAGTGIRHPSFAIFCLHTPRHESSALMDRVLLRLIPV